ncbi:UNVERIFIED_CONTAM: NADH-ubiquinone oxidoreductase chain 6 [Sesamum latifolium]|uniref:NADH-ubiquinone oxidoreductase chain 6 n=1 Tax=Sesamum latifolium TaxID=2727402 RepID=A0AAW2SG08_9LAMI
MKVPFQGRTTYYDTFCFVEPCFGLWFDGCLDFFAMIFPVVHIGAIAVSFLFVVMMFNIQIAEIHEEVLRYLPEDYNEEDDRPHSRSTKEKESRLILVQIQFVSTWAIVAPWTWGLMGFRLPYNINWVGLYVGYGSDRMLSSV